MRWYLVKTNWPQSSQAAQNLGLADYCGLGGLLWPLDEAGDSLSKELSKRVESSREYVEMTDGSTAFVLTNVDLAKEYYTHCKNLGLLAYLLEIELATVSVTEANGFDLGNPEGGYSMIESEILIRGDKQHAKRLNEFGVLSSVDDGIEILSQVEDSSDLDGYEFVSIKAAYRPTTYTAKPRGGDEGSEA